MIYKILVGWGKKKSILFLKCVMCAGPCQEWRNTSDCVMTSANLLSIIKATQDEAACQDECLNFQEQENKLCWGFSFSVSASGCTIHIGENPVLCSENPSVTYSPGTSFTWIRQCFNGTLTSSIEVLSCLLFQRTKMAFFE